MGSAVFSFYIDNNLIFSFKQKKIFRVLIYGYSEDHVSIYLLFKNSNNKNVNVLTSLGTSKKPTNYKG